MAAANQRWTVGTIKAPRTVAIVADNNTIRKSSSNRSPVPLTIPFSIRLARNGPKKLFDVRDTSTSTLNKAKDKAILCVRTPAMRAA